jgi:hypothetical protein
MGRRPSGQPPELVRQAKVCDLGDHMLSRLLASSLLGELEGAGDLGFV